MTGGAAHFNNATPGAATTQSFTLSGGTQGGSGRFEVTDYFGWTGGSLGGSVGAMTGTTRVGPIAAVEIVGSVDHLIIGSGGPYTLENAGNIQWFEGNIRGAAGRINNLAGGVFAASSTGQMFVNGGDGDAVFNNAGEFWKQGASTTTIGAGQGFGLENSGIVDVLQGTLVVNSTLSGGFTQTAGETRLNSGSAIAGTATLANQGGTLVGRGTISRTTFRTLAAPSAQGFWRRGR